MRRSLIAFFAVVSIVALHSTTVLAQSKFQDLQVVAPDGGTITITAPTGLGGDVPITLPSSGGSLITTASTPGAGDVLTHNGSDHEWVPLTAFSFNSIVDHVATAGSNLPIVFALVDYNYNGSWDGAVYTVSETGLYHFDVKVTVRTSEALPQNARIALYINSVPYRGAAIDLLGVDLNHHLTLNLDCSLTAGDQVEVRYDNSHENVFVQGSDGMWFTGHRIR